MTRGQLRWNYRRVHRNVYLPKHASRSLRENIIGAWLWSGRRAVIASRAAAALHGAKWVDEFTPIEIIGPFNHPPPGIIVRRERLGAMDVVELDGLPVTNLARTAFDLARHLPSALAVTHLDALSAHRCHRRRSNPFDRHPQRSTRRAPVSNSLDAHGRWRAIAQRKLVAALTHRCRSAPARYSDPGYRWPPRGLPGYGSGTADGGSRVRRRTTSHRPKPVCERHPPSRDDQSARLERDQGDQRRPT